MEILIPSLISALALGAFCCPALARPVDYLLSGGTITTIPTFDLTAVPDWWLSGGFAYGFTKGKYLFEPERHVLLDGSTGSGKTRFCLIQTIDLLTYGDGANGSEPVSIAVTDVKNELIAITGAELERRGYDVLLLDTQNPYRGHRFNPINPRGQTRRKR